MALYLEFFLRSPRGLGFQFLLFFSSTLRFFSFTLQSFLLFSFLLLSFLFSSPFGLCSLLPCDLCFFQFQFRLLFLFKSMVHQQLRQELHHSTVIE